MGERSVQSEKIDKRSIAIIPYYHGISHLLKRIALSYNIEVIFSYQAKFESLPAIVNREKVACKNLSTHKPFLDCKKNVVYSMPLICGMYYVGQTGACVNFRLTTHESDLKKCKSTEGKRLVEHARNCDLCSDECMRFNNSGILCNYKDRLTREMIETFYIRESENVISV